MTGRSPSQILVHILMSLANKYPCILVNVTIITSHLCFIPRCVHLSQSRCFAVCFSIVGSFLYLCLCQSACRSPLSFPSSSSPLSLPPPLSPATSLPPVPPLSPSHFLPFDCLFVAPYLPRLIFFEFVVCTKNQSNFGQHNDSAVSHHLEAELIKRRLFVSFVGFVLGVCFSLFHVVAFFLLFFVFFFCFCFFCTTFLLFSVAVGFLFVFFG